MFRQSGMTVGGGWLAACLRPREITGSRTRLQSSKTGRMRSLSHVEPQEILGPKPRNREHFTSYCVRNGLPSLSPASRGASRATTLKGPLSQFLSSNPTAPASEQA